MKSLRLLFCLILSGCGGNLEKDRICLGHPCAVPWEETPCGAYEACYRRNFGGFDNADYNYGPMGACWTTSP